MKKKKIRADISPDPYMLHSFRKREVPVTEALCEFIDNAFGKNRGDATSVGIMFVQKEQRLEVWDNGRGIAQPERMFKLGTRPDEDDLAEVTLEDIGRWGVGGTGSAAALGSLLTVHTIYEGRYASASIDWDALADSAAFPELDYEWVPAKEAPEWVRSRLNEGHGTVLEIQDVDRYPKGMPGKFFAGIKDEIREIYSPALLNGRSIWWYQSYRSRRSYVGEPLDAKVPDVKVTVEEALTIPSGTGTLTAKLFAGYSPNLPATQSAVDVFFGTRRLQQTREPFQGAGGIGVYARLELGGEWRKHLTTHKQGVRSTEEWAVLSDLVHTAIKPLLDQADEARQTMRIKALDGKLRIDLEERLERIMTSTAPEKDDPTITPLPEGEGNSSDDPTIDVREPLQENGEKEARRQSDEGAPRKEKRGLPVVIDHANEKVLPGVMARATLDWITPKQPVINIVLNNDHPYVAAAIQADRIGDRAVYSYIVMAEAAKALAQAGEHTLNRMLPAHLADIARLGILETARKLEALIMREAS